MGETVSHNGVTFALIPLEECLTHALHLRDRGGRWHSHVLSPQCTHNPYPGRYAIVIEDDDAGCAVLAPSDGFPEVDKQLVKLLHGDDILEAAKSGRASAAQSPLLARLQDIQARGVHWHHHMHFPACVLNPHRGQWCIAIESDEGTFAEAYTDEPVDILREIEVLYFGNLADDQGQAIA